MSTAPAPHPPMAPAEWQARVDTAACYRLIAREGMTDMIFTHVTTRVPDSPDHLLINPYGYFFEEVRASNLVKFDLDGRVVEDTPHTINPVGHTFHTWVHRARPDVACVIHTHSEAGLALSALACGLLPITQHAMRFKDRVAYHHYDAVNPSPAELDALVAALGDKPVMVMHNHGLLACGRTVAEAFHYIHYLESCCRIQLAVMQTGQPLAIPPARIIDKAARYFQQNRSIPGSREWPALLRLLDREQPDYKT